MIKYGSMQVINWTYTMAVEWKVCELLLDYGSVFQWAKIVLDILMKNITLKCKVWNFWQKYD